MYRTVRWMERSLRLSVQITRRHQRTAYLKVNALTLDNVTLTVTQVA